jgi:hypothetical protein
MLDCRVEVGRIEALAGRQQRKDLRRSTARDLPFDRSYQRQATIDDQQSDPTGTVRDGFLSVQKTG